MEIIKPPRLIPGKSVVGIIAPSGIVEKTWIIKGLKVLIDRDYSIKLGRHILRRIGDWSAGTKIQRLVGYSDISILLNVFASGGLFAFMVQILVGWWLLLEQILIL